MAKSIWDQLGDIAGGAVNGVGQFLGTAGQDIGNFVGGAEKNIGQMFSGGAAPAPTAAPAPPAPNVTGPAPQLGASPMPWANNPLMMNSMNPAGTMAPPPPPPPPPQPTKQKPATTPSIMKSSGSSDPTAIKNDFNNIDKFQPADQIGLIQRAYRAGMMHPADMTTAINQIVDGETAKANAPQQDPGTGNWLLDQATGLGNGIIKTGSTVGDLGAEIISSLTGNKANLAAAKQQFSEDAPQSIPGQVEHGFEQLAAPAGAALAGNDLLNKGYDAGDVKSAMDAQTANTGVSTDADPGANALKIASGAAQTVLTIATLGTPVYGKMFDALGAGTGKVLDSGAALKYIGDTAKANGTSLLKESLKSGLNQAAIGGVNGIVSTFGQDKFNSGDFIKNALGGAIGGEVLGTVTPYASAGLDRVLHSPDALIHEQLMKTNPDYAEAASNSFLLGEKIKHTKDPALVQQLTDVKNNLDATLKYTRQKTLASGQANYLTAGASDAKESPTPPDNLSYEGTRSYQTTGPKATTNAFPDVKFTDLSDTHTAVRQTRDALVKQTQEIMATHPEEFADLPPEMKTAKALRAQAEDEMRTNPTYHDLMSKAQAEVDNANAPAQALKEVQNSPEYAAKSKAWQDLSLAKEELANQEDLLKSYDKQQHGLRSRGRSNDALSNQQPEIRFKWNALRNQVRELSRQYKVASDAVTAKYPDVTLERPGAAKRAQSRKLTLKNKQQLEKEQNDYLNQPANEYHLGADQALGSANNPVKVEEVNPDGSRSGESQYVTFPSDDKITQYREKKAANHAQGSGYASLKSDIIIEDEKGNKYNSMPYDEAVKKWGTTDRTELAHKLVNGDVTPSSSGKLTIKSSKPAPRTQLSPQEEISAIYRQANNARNGKLTISEENRIAELKKSIAPKATDDAYEEAFGAPKATDDANFTAKEETTNRATQEQTPKTEKQLRLEAETKVFAKLREGGSIEDAAKAYQEVHPVDDATALAEVNKIADTGAAMGDLEKVLGRNEQYKSFDTETEPKNLHEISTQVNGHANLFEAAKGTLARISRKLSQNDMAAMDDVRGQSIDDFMKAYEGQLDNPDLVKKYLTTSKEALDNLHEYGRVNMGTEGVGLYRQNRGAGLYSHDPEAVPGEPSEKDLNTSFGTSKERHFDSYDEIEKSTGNVRSNANYHEDVMRDLNGAHTIKAREIERLLAAKYGPDAVSYGKPTGDRTTYLNGAKSVFTTKAIASKWNRLNKAEDTTTGIVHVAKKVNQKVNSGIVQSTVYNAAIHTGNLVWQAVQAAGTINHFGMSGLAKSLKSASDLMHDKAQLSHWTNDYMKNGGHIDFANHEPGWISKATKDHAIGLSEFNKEALYQVDRMSRVSIYKAMRDAGIDGREAVKRIDDFMGDDVSMGQAASILGFFVKFFKTTTTSLAKQVAHPIKYSGATQNLVLLAGAWIGLNYASQQLTGNKNTYWRAPGNLGIIKEVVNGIIGIANGDNGKAASQIVTNRVNPGIKEVLQQAFDKDFYTGKSLEESGGRGAHAINTLLSPVNQGSGVVDNKKSLLEQVLNTGVGFYTPHAKGDVATTNPALSALNTPGAKVAPGNDPTGYQQQQAYFNSSQQVMNSLPPARQDALKQFLKHDTDSNGNPISVDEKQARANADYLYANPDILQAITRQKQLQAKMTGQPVDPLYSNKYTDAQRLEYEKIQSTPYKGDDFVNQEDPNKAWITQLGQDRANFFAGTNMTSALPSRRIAPPTFDAPTEAAMNTASALTGQAKYDYMAQHPEIQAAYDKISQYTNDRREAQGFNAFKAYPTAPPDVRAAMMDMTDTKNKTGSSSSWIKANPAEYSKIQSYLASSAEWELANSAGADKYAGATPSQQELKSAYSLGKYDIAKTPMVGGGFSYSIDPTTAYAQSAPSFKKFYGSSTGGGSSNSSLLRMGKIGIYDSRKHNGLSVTRARTPKAYTRAKTVQITKGSGNGKLHISSKKMII
jgi:hypothetical protein